MSTNIVLANVDYRSHMTDEGAQLQDGLQLAGWTLVGAGFEHGCKYVPSLLGLYAPRIVVIQDRRDWDPDSRISFRKDIGFDEVKALRRATDIVKVAVFKDAGTGLDIQRRYFQEMGVQVLLTYYHADSIRPGAPWIDEYQVVRIYHSVDSEQIPPFQLDRRGVLVSGAVGSGVYPMRTMAVRMACGFGWDVLRHPGYGNGGVRTNDYLAKLSGYRVHIATSSRFGFALRKIIESVACGATPVTDLPEHDVLPHIDGALVRVPQGASLEQLAEAVTTAEASWDPSERRLLAEQCRGYYDWRIAGARCSRAILRAAFQASGRVTA
jgi:hypothetical protein